MSIMQQFGCKGCKRTSAKSQSSIGGISVWSRPTANRDLNGRSGSSLRTTPVAEYAPSGRLRLPDGRVKLPLADSILRYLGQDTKSAGISLI